MQQIPLKCFLGKGQIHLKAFANQKRLILLTEMNVSKETEHISQNHLSMFINHIVYKLEQKKLSKFSTFVNV